MLLRQGCSSGQWARLQPVPAGAAQRAWARRRAAPTPPQASHSPPTSSCPHHLQVALLTHLCYMAYYESVGLTAEEYVRDAVAALIWDARSDDLDALGLVDRAAEVEQAAAGGGQASPSPSPSPSPEPEPQPQPEPSPSPPGGRWRSRCWGARTSHARTRGLGFSRRPGVVALPRTPASSQPTAHTAASPHPPSRDPPNTCTAADKPEQDKPASKPGKATAVTDSSGGKKKETGEEKPDVVGPPGTHKDWVLDCKGGRVRCWNLVLASMG